MIELMTGTFMGMPIWLLGIQLSVPIVVFAWLVKVVHPSDLFDWTGIIATSVSTFYLMIAATVVVYMVVYGL